MGFRITMLKSAIVGLLFALHATDAVEKTSGHPVMNRLSRLMSHHRRLCPYKTYCPGVSDGQGGCTTCDGTFHLKRRRRLCQYDAACEGTTGSGPEYKCDQCGIFTVATFADRRRRLCHSQGCVGHIDLTTGGRRYC